jgi:hypothetical protein
MEEDTTLPLPLTMVKSNRVEVAFDEPAVSSDGGVLLLRQLDEKLNVSAKVTAAISEYRQIARCDHELLEMTRQRIYQICAGYPDANDCNHLRADPVFKTVVGRHPEKGKDLASQPTMTRLENSIRNRDLIRMAYAIMDLFIASYKTPPRSIIIDMDPTTDIVYGNQQLRLFNAFEDEYCFMPFHVYEGNSGKLITTVLRPGKTPTAREILAVLKRIVTYLRKAWPKVKITFRADRQHTRPEVMDWMEKPENAVEYITGFTPNSRLDAIFETAIHRAQRRFERTGEPTREYCGHYYAANSWSHKRWLVCRVLVSEKGTDVRYIVTSLSGDSESLYERKYCARGKAELFIKDHKTHLESDRTSCSSKRANQFRLLLHSAAYILLHSLRSSFPVAAEFATAQFNTIQIKLLKIGARLEILSRRLRFHLPESCPSRHAFTMAINSLSSG